MDNIYTLGLQLAIIFIVDQTVEHFLNESFGCLVYKMFYFVHNPKVFSLLSWRSKETRKYSHLNSKSENFDFFP